jgi:hypothetical protein
MARSSPPKRGRPAIAEGEPSWPLTVRVSATDYDRTCERATRERIGVSELVRRALTRLLEDDERDD